MARRSLLTPQSPQKNQTSKNEWVDKETYFVLLSVVKITTLDWGVPCVWLVRRWEITGFTHRLIFTLFIWWGSFSRHRYFSAKHVTFTCSLELASFLFNPLLHQRGTSLCSGPCCLVSATPNYWWVRRTHSEIWKRMKRNIVMGPQMQISWLRLKGGLVSRNLSKPL